MLQSSYVRRDGLAGRRPRGRRRWLGWALLATGLAIACVGVSSGHGLILAAGLVMLAAALHVAFGSATGERTESSRR